MTRLIKEIFAGALLTIAFIVITITLIKSPLPHHYLSYYLALEILAFIFFSLFGAIIVAILSTITALGTLIIAESWFAVAAMFSYWASTIIFARYLSDVNKEYGKQKLEIENQEKNIGSLTLDEKLFTNQIPVLNERIIRYLKMADFSLQLSTSFDDEKLYSFILDYVKNFFNCDNIFILTTAEDQYDMWIYDKKAPLLIENTHKDYRFKSDPDQEAASIIECPIFLDNEVSALIKASSTNVQFSPSDLRLLNIAATLSSIALERARLFRQTEELAITDDLTNLYTNTYFKERLNEEVIRSARYDETFAVLMMDIDNYKHFNDTFGHQAGDIVLKNVADSIKKTVRDTDIISRYGGEEISAILHNISQRKAKSIAEKIRSAIEGMEFVFDYRKVNVTITIGISTFPDFPTAEVLLRRADEALYKGKEKGKNCVIFAGKDV